MQFGESRTVFLKASTLFSNYPKSYIIPVPHYYYELMIMCVEFTQFFRSIWRRNIYCCYGWLFLAKSWTFYSRWESNKKKFHIITYILLQIQYFLIKFWNSLKLIYKIQVKKIVDDMARDIEVFVQTELQRFNGHR